MARKISIGPFLTISGDGTVNDARVKLLYRLVVNPQTLGYPWSEPLHNNIAFLCQSIKNGTRFPNFQVEYYASFVAIHNRPLVHDFGCKSGLLDFDHFSPHVGQYHHAVRPGQKPAQI